MWFFVAAISYFVLACVIVIDKKIVSGAKVMPSVYAAYSTLPAALFFLALPFVSFLAEAHLLLAISSGVSFGLALWSLFHALERSEASHIGPFGGALITVFVAILSWTFLGETLSVGKRTGVLVLVVASLLLSRQKRRVSERRGGFFWALLAALFFAVSHVSAKYLYGVYSFSTVLVWTKGTISIVGLIILAFPRVRHAIHTQWLNTRPSRGARKSPIQLVIMDKFLGFIGELGIQYAIMLGSVTLVNALIGLQYVFLFFLIVLLSRFAPRVFHEEITKREYVIQTIAVLLVAIGSASFVL